MLILDRKLCVSKDFQRHGNSAILHNDYRNYWINEHAVDEKLKPGRGREISIWEIDDPFVALDVDESGDADDISDDSGFERLDVLFWNVGSLRPGFIA